MDDDDVSNDCCCNASKWSELIVFEIIKKKKEKHAKDQKYIHVIC